ncbi:cytochrome c [Flavilitoribacter nigricans]|uniref:Cytochrome c n=1 Tax=Flavilitoribacter nigricans (strain ATCC 23147 / DSM 23189 / NBRC 102662 / NCIMB 1420 / SS-2) TaxID=1122177 RepID=A0A2D0NIC5_FLAN2|nr:cytochrome c [Flavilitoribacter nigricans]PHN07939.1 cytochrome c [Flavilitoribacter nigricans DSM 23189 = NBRC 102662]
MKKVLKIAGIILGIVLVLIGGFALYINATGIPSYDLELPENYAVSADSASLTNGEKLVRLTCMDCHINYENQLLEGKKMFDVPASFGEVWSANLNHPETGLKSYSNEELAYLLRTGVKKDGKYAPPWMVKFPNMADEDLRDIIAFLRSDHPMLQPSEVRQPAPRPSFLVKFLSHVAFKPFPYPQQEIALPNAGDQIARGQYVADAVAGCFSCHSADFTTIDEYTPVNSAGYYGGGNLLKDAAGQDIYSANLTMHPETGIGNWSEQQFIDAVKWGKGPKYPVRVPMPKYTDLTDDEIRAIFAYLKTIPVIENSVDRTR